MGSNRESLLKLAIQVVNDKSNPFRRGHDITLKDFDTAMNGKLMIDVVSSILSCIDPTFNERTFNSMSRLPRFEQFGFASMTYDSTAEVVFKAARKFFPQADDSLHMSSFLVPQLDIKKAKQVIIFLTGYFVVSDQIHEKFETEWERLNLENQDKSRLFEEIEGLRNTIAEKVIKLQSNKDAKPQTVQKFEELIYILKDAGKKEDSLERSRHEFDSKNKEIEDLNKAIGLLDTDQDRLQSEINKRMQFYEEECAKLAEELKGKHLQVENLEFRMDEIISKLDEIDCEISKASAMGQKYTMDINRLSVALEEGLVNYQKRLEEQGMMILQVVRDSVGKSFYDKHIHT